MRDYDEIRKEFYKKYDAKELEQQLISFINQKLDISNFNDAGKKYNKLINNFFEEDIYSASTRRCGKNAKSPNDALYDDELLDKIFTFIDTKPKFYNGNDLTNLKSFFRNGGRYSSKVANFSPNVARKIYERYCPKKNANILDYSCGFGSRMLGCLTSQYNYSYFGIEPNSILTQHLNKFGEYINSFKKVEYKIYCQGSEDYIEELINKIDLAFSSPPYYNLEKYTNEETQSIVKFPNYNDWLQYYVKPTIKNIYNYLKDEGLFILNIKNLTQGTQEKLADDWVKIAKNEHFILLETIDMKHQTGRMSLGKYKEENGLTNYTGIKEPLFIFKKQGSKMQINKEKQMTIDDFIKE